MANGGVPLYQSSATLSARGPITAMRLSAVAFSGRRLPSFFSSTMDSSVTLRASALFFSHSHGSSTLPWRASKPICAYGSLAARIEHSQPDHHAKDPAQVVVDVGLLDQSLRQRVLHRLGCVLQKLVDAGVNGCSGCLRHGRVGVMRAHHIAQRAGVGADDAVEAPILHHHIAQHGIGAHGHLVPCVVGGHHGVGVTILNRHAKRHSVVLVKEAVVEVGAGSIAAIFVAVCQKMLQQRRGHPCLRVVALQPSENAVASVPTRNGSSP